MFSLITILFFTISEKVKFVTENGLMKTKINNIVISEYGTPLGPYTDKLFITYLFINTNSK